MFPHRPESSQLGQVLHVSSQSPRRPSRDNVHRIMQCWPKQTGSASVIRASQIHFTPSPGALRQGIQGTQVMSLAVSPVHHGLHVASFHAAVATRISPAFANACPNSRWNAQSNRSAVNRSRGPYTIPPKGLRCSILHKPNPADLVLHASPCRYANRHMRETGRQCTRRLSRRGRPLPCITSHALERGPSIHAGPRQTHLCGCSDPRRA